MVTKRKSNRKEGKSDMDLAKQIEQKPSDSMGKTPAAKQPQKTKPKKASPKRATVPLSERAKTLVASSPSVDSEENGASLPPYVKAHELRNDTEKPSIDQDVVAHNAVEKHKNAQSVFEEFHRFESGTPNKKHDCPEQLDFTKEERSQKEKKRPTLRAPRARSKKEKAALKAQMEQTQADAQAQEQVQAELSVDSLARSAATLKDPFSPVGDFVTVSAGQSVASGSHDSLTGESQQFSQDGSPDTLATEGIVIVADQADITAVAASAAADVKSSRQAKEERKRRRKAIPWAKIIIGAFFVCILTAASVFSWDRWFRYDDAHDIQGEWQPTGTDASIVIDGTQIKLTDEVAYSYELDTGAKTISYTFGSLKGQGRYRFSWDRQSLVIVDGEGYTAISTLFEDASWMFDQFICSLTNKPQELMSVTETARFFSRLSGDTQAIPHPMTGISAEDGEEQQALIVGEPEATSTEDDPTKQDGSTAEGADGTSKGDSGGAEAQESSAGEQSRSSNESINATASANSEITLNSILDMA